MTGVTAVIAAGAAGASSLYDISIGYASSVGNVVPNASGTIREANFDVSTNGPDPTTSFSYSISRTSGSAKITATKVANATAGFTPTWRFDYSNLAVGEYVTADFRVTATKAGYNDGINRYTIDVRRSS